jgi:hypothetical protein
MNADDDGSNDNDIDISSNATNYHDIRASDDKNHSYTPSSSTSATTTNSEIINIKSNIINPFHTPSSPSYSLPHGYTILNNNDTSNDDLLIHVNNTTSINPS